MAARPRTVIPVGADAPTIHEAGLDSANRCMDKLRREWPLYMAALAADKLPMPPERLAPSGLDIDKYNYLLPLRIQPWYSGVASLPGDAFGQHAAPYGFPASPVATYGTFKGLYLCTFESMEVLQLFCEFARADISAEHAPSWMWAERGAP